MTATRVSRGVTLISISSLLAMALMRLNNCVKELRLKAYIEIDRFEFSHQ